MGALLGYSNGSKHLPTSQGWHLMFIKLNVKALFSRVSSSCRGLALVPALSSCVRCHHHMVAVTISQTQHMVLHTTCLQCLVLQRRRPWPSVSRSVAAELDMASLIYGHPNIDSPHVLALLGQAQALPLVLALRIVLWHLLSTTSNLWMPGLHALSGIRYQTNNLIHPICTPVNHPRPRHRHSIAAT